jgi:hypothetical protein
VTRLRALSEPIGEIAAKLLGLPIFAREEARMNASRDEAIIERVNRRYNQPGLLEKGLELLAEAQEEALAKAAR